MHMKILLRCFVILALALPAVCQDTASFGGNSQHTGVDLAKRNIASSVVQDQVVYVGSVDGNLYALM
jgi:hypothetical protein